MRPAIPLLLLNALSGVFTSDLARGWGDSIEWKGSYSNYYVM